MNEVKYIEKLYLCILNKQKYVIVKFSMCVRLVGKNMVPWVNVPWRVGIHLSGEKSSPHLNDIFFQGSPKKNKYVPGTPNIHLFVVVSIG